MNNLLSLDETLFYLNENENNNFNSILESINISILCEGINIKSIGEKLKEIVKFILKQIKKAKEYIKKKIESLSMHIKEMQNNNVTDDIKEVQWNNYNFTYNNKTYSIDNINNLIAVLNRDLGGNHIFNLKNAALSKNIDDLKEGFENFKDYQYHKEFNANISIEKIVVKGTINEFLEDSKKIVNKIDLFKKEYDWVEKHISDINKSIDKILSSSNYEDDEKQIRLQILSYILERFKTYSSIMFNIQSKLYIICE